MHPKQNFVVALPMGAHVGKCRECGAAMQIAGGPGIGRYLIPAHHSADIAAATNGAMCPGGDQRPGELVRR